MKQVIFLIKPVYKIYVSLMCRTCPYVGREYSTFVDALLMDVVAIDDFACLRYTNILHNTIYVDQYFSTVFTIDKLIVQSLPNLRSIFL